MINTGAVNVALFSAFLFSVLSITFALDKKTSPKVSIVLSALGFSFLIGALIAMTWADFAKGRQQTVYHRQNIIIDNSVTNPTSARVAPNDLRRQHLGVSVQNEEDVNPSS